MAKTKRQPDLRCQTHFLSDRHVSQKLSQVYQWLVPEPPPGDPQAHRELTAAAHEKDCRHLHSSFF